MLRLNPSDWRRAFNVFPSLKGGDFRLPEADVPARDEEIDRRVDVPIMPNTTAATAPLSHYEALSTLWAAAYTARGTDLRGESLVNLDVLTPVPHGFVVELGSKLRPAGTSRACCRRCRPVVASLILYRYVSTMATG